MNEYDEEDTFNPNALVQVNQIISMGKASLGKPDAEPTK